MISILIVNKHELSFLIGFIHLVMSMNLDLTSAHDIVLWFLILIPILHCKYRPDGRLSGSFYRLKDGDFLIIFPFIGNFFTELYFYRSSSTVYYLWLDPSLCLLSPYTLKTWSQPLDLHLTPLAHGSW